MLRLFEHGGGDTVISPGRGLPTIQHHAGRRQLLCARRGPRHQAADITISALRNRVSSGATRDPAGARARQLPPQRAGGGFVQPHGDASDRGRRGKGRRPLRRGHPDAQAAQGGGREAPPDHGQGMNAPTAKGGKHHGKGNKEQTSRTPKKGVSAVPEQTRPGPSTRQPSTSSRTKARSPSSRTCRG